MAIPKNRVSVSGANTDLSKLKDYIKTTESYSFATDVVTKAQSTSLTISDGVDDVEKVSDKFFKEVSRLIPRGTTKDELLGYKDVVTKGIGEIRGVLGWSLDTKSSLSSDTVPCDPKEDENIFEYLSTEVLNHSKRIHCYTEVVDDTTTLSDKLLSKALDTSLAQLDNTHIVEQVNNIATLVTSEKISNDIASNLIEKNINNITGDTKELIGGIDTIFGSNVSEVMDNETGRVVSELVKTTADICEIKIKHSQSLPPPISMTDAIPPISNTSMYALSLLL